MKLVKIDGWGVELLNKKNGKIIKTIPRNEIELFDVTLFSENFLFKCS